MNRCAWGLWCLVVGCVAPSTDEAWVEVWTDDFDGPAGSAPDLANWRFDIGGDGWGNQQLEYNTDRRDNVYLDGNGNLRIRAQRETFEGNAWTSGRIKTEDRFAWYKGRFSARIKLPAGEGIWPAFWMLGQDFADVGWPVCGEIDIMEGDGAQTNRMYGTVHGPGYSGGSSVGSVFESPDFDTTDWHVYAVEVDEGHIAWMVDGEVYHRVTRADLPVGQPWVFDHPYFILLNVAVGGNFVTPPTEDTPDVSEMVVDFVRVAQRAP